jgi:hypothetical protein
LPKGNSLTWKPAGDPNSAEVPHQKHLERRLPASINLVHENVGGKFLRITRSFAGKKIATE